MAEENHLTFVFWIEDNQSERTHKVAAPMGEPRTRERYLKKAAASLSIPRTVKEQHRNRGA